MTASSFIENLPCFLACPHSSQTERIFKIWDEFFPFARPVTREPARIAPHPRFPTPLAHKFCTKSPVFNLFRTEPPWTEPPDGAQESPGRKREKTKKQKRKGPLPGKPGLFPVLYKQYCKSEDDKIRGSSHIREGALSCTGCKAAYPY